MFTKREIVVLVGAFLIAAALGTRAAVYVIDTYVIADQDDPSARTGSLRPMQDIRVK